MVKGQKSPLIVCILDSVSTLTTSTYPYESQTSFQPTILTHTVSLGIFSLSIISLRFPIVHLQSIFFFLATTIPFYGFFNSAESQSQWVVTMTMRNVKNLKINCFLGIIVIMITLSIISNFSFSYEKNGSLKAFLLQMIMIPFFSGPISEAEKDDEHGGLGLKGKPKNQ